MDLGDLAPAGRIFPALRVNSKKQLMQELAHRVAPQAGVAAREMLDALLEREQLGATAVGGGVAIPHCRMANLSSIYGAFARLESPVDFEAVDGAPVDVVFMLAAPTCAGADHLKALARVSRALRDAAICEKLRGAQDVAAIQALLSASPQLTAA